MKRCTQKQVAAALGIVLERKFFNLLDWPLNHFNLNESIETQASAAKNWFIGDKNLH